MDRGVVVGNTSFGKGLVQQTKQVSFGGQIKLTVAKYYTPSGRCIQKLDYSTGINSNTIADSLVQEYRTQNGRVVTDSRGIEPDVSIDPSYYSTLTEKLLFDDYVFDFANNIIDEISDSINPSTFEISDSMYRQFSNYILTQEIKYETASNRLLESLKEAAIKEELLKENMTIFVKLDSVFKTNIERDLDKYQEEIKFFLENEIISRKHFHSGRIEAALKYDSCVIKAQDILNTDSIYNFILGKK